MAKRVTNYQCPSCTAPLRFVPESGRLECAFCDSRYYVHEIEEMYGTEAQAERQRSTEDLWGEGAEQMRAFSCPSCGASLMCEETTAATSCPFCGNHVIISKRFAGVRRPDCVLPFKLSKEAAVSALRNSCRHKPLIPDAFSAKTCLQEIKGVYVPFWLFDGVANADILFDGTKSHSVTYGDEEEITTEHYDVRREGFVEFDNLPVDALSVMDDGYMDAIEPYDFSELQPFAMAYLPGFVAECSDVSDEAAFVRAARRMKNSARTVMKNTVLDYDEVSVQRESVQVSRRRAHYALLPVWMLTASYDGRSYLFAVNGQTGKAVGRFPICPKKLKTAATVLSGAVGVAAAAAITAILTWLL